MNKERILHPEEANYVAPEEEAVRQKLEWFKDQKLALMVHWGPYSQWGVMESWPLSDADAVWSRKMYGLDQDPEKFRAQYRALNRTFNPVRFDADEWADFAKEVGFRYFIFTTKHHDGFCMYDSKYSDYKITAPDCPFSENPKADIVRELFSAFREREIAIAPYFSKPDWHCPWYWAENCEKPVACDRNTTYDPRVRKDIWEQFTRYTQNQLLEIVSEYGPVDILWLDGGQVNPINQGQDIRMAEIAKAARKIVPDLLFADRTVGGPYENYVTPEQKVPEYFLNVPWESCVTIGTGFSYRYDDDYKSPRELVRILINVVTRGGNIAFNLGGQPDGRLPRHGMQSALGLGEWLKTYGEAIFETRAVDVGEDGKNRDLSGYETAEKTECFGFTKKGETFYALRPLAENERIPEEAFIPWTKGARSVSLVGTGENLPFSATLNGISVRIPEPLRSSAPLALAFAIRL